jgi:ABC-type transport system involved in cytochrome c biogenesis permease subunit
MTAVLDTQFWLLLHVTCIATGYVGMFVAGLFGVAYIVLGVATPTLSREDERQLARVVYGIVCFATLFSFFGTVLGGLWADDSWGRFWGWDTKENGALLIVLWSALVLHARWGKIVGDRGMAMLAVFGNVVTAFSWFGVNALGVGLHAYGHKEGVIPALIVFSLVHLAIMGVATIPKELWRSHQSAQAEEEA